MLGMMMMMVVIMIDNDNYEDDVMMTETHKGLNHVAQFHAPKYSRLIQGFHYHFE